MQATSSALFFVIPVFSLILLYIRLSAQHSAASSSHPESRNRSFISHFAFFSFGILSVTAGSLGLAACTFDRSEVRYFNMEAGDRIVVALIKFELILSVIYIFATKIPCSVVSPFKVLVINIALNLLLGCATIFNLLSPFLNPQYLHPIVCPILSLVTAIFPFPLLAVVLHSPAAQLNLKAMRFWFTLGCAQIAAIICSIFGILATKDYAFADAFRIVESSFLVLWIIGIISVFHLLPARHTEYNRASLRFRPSKSPSPSVSSSAHSFPPHTSDFRNLRDPFASPTPCSPVADKISFSYFGPPPNIFKPMRAKGNASRQALNRTSSLPPSALSVNGIGPGDIVDCDQDEAILSQLLLQSLDSDIDFKASLRQRESAVDLGFGVGFPDIAMDSAKREKIIMTCERRGSESTLTSSHYSHRDGYSPSSPSFPLTLNFQRQWCRHGSTCSATTLYEPSSPVSPTWKETAFDLPVSPVVPGVMHGDEKDVRVSPRRQPSIHESPAEQDPATNMEMQTLDSQNSRC